MSKLGTPPMYKFRFNASCVKAPGVMTCEEGCESTCKMASRPVLDIRRRCHSLVVTGYVLLR